MFVARASSSSLYHYCWSFHCLQVRVARFGSGSGEDKTSLLRVIAGNGSRLHIWLQRGRVHVVVHESPATALAAAGSGGGSGTPSLLPSSPTPVASASASASGSGGGGARGVLGGLISAAANRAAGAAGSVAAATSRTSPAAGGAGSSLTLRTGSNTGGGTGVNDEDAAIPGLHAAVADAPALVEGGWVSLHVHHCIKPKTFLQSKRAHELVVCVNGQEVSARYNAF